MGEELFDFYFASGVSFLLSMMVVDDVESYLGACVGIWISEPKDLGEIRWAASEPCRRKPHATLNGDGVFVWV